MDIPEHMPDSGAVFTFGNSKFSDNNAGCFWLKNDVITSASCGDEHTAFVTESGKLYVFGSNDWGQLGLGHTHQVNKPTCVKSLKMHNVSMVACGRNHTIACTANNKIFVFGNNSDSQLGVDDIDSSNLPLEVNVVNNGAIKQIGAGADFSVALTSDGDIYVWGSNVEGQLGLGSEVNEAIKPTLLKTINQVKYVACGYYHMAAVTVSGDLYTFGEDEYGKLGIRDANDNCVPSKVKLPVKVVAVACGGSHTAIISKNNDLYTMGDGTRGELGHGENVLQTSTPMLIERLRGHHVSEVSCGENFTCAITKKGRLYTFGDGRHGKLAVNEENFTNQFKPFRCTKFDKCLVSFAECGGCHMVAYARFDKMNEGIPNTDSEGEDPMQTLNGNINSSELLASRSIKGAVEDKLGVDENISVNLSRSLSAREKRRQGRENIKNRTLPPLKTLKPIELEEAARSLPRPTQSSRNYDFINEWSHGSPQKDTDAVSEISAFNKVHMVQQVGDINTLTPIHAKPRKVETDSKKDTKKQHQMNENGEILEIKSNESTPVIVMNGEHHVELNDQKKSDDKIIPPSMDESDDDDEEDADDEEETADEEDELSEEDNNPEINKQTETSTQEDGSDKQEQTENKSEKNSLKDDPQTSSVHQEKQKKGKLRWFKKDKKDKVSKTSQNASGDGKQGDTDNFKKNVNGDAENQDIPSKTEQNTSGESGSTSQEATGIINESGDTTTSGQKDSPQQEQTTNEAPATGAGNPTGTKKQKSKFCNIL
ncbi:uncharacterized protein LOC120340578 [Styela clava]